MEDVLKDANDFDQEDGNGEDDGIQRARKGEKHDRDERALQG